MKHVAITDAKSQLETLVAEIETTGDEFVTTRDGVAVARLIREASAKPDFTPEEIERRREVIRNLRKRARELNLGATQEEIKESINEGRH